MATIIYINVYIYNTMGWIKPHIHVYIYTGEEQPTIGPCLKSFVFCPGGARPRESDGSPQQQDVHHL